MSLTFQRVILAFGVCTSLVRAFTCPTVCFSCQNMTEICPLPRLWSDDYLDVCNCCPICVTLIGKLSANSFLFINLFLAALLILACFEFHILSWFLYNMTGMNLSDVHFFQIFYSKFYFQNTLLSITTRHRCQASVGWYLPLYAKCGLCDALTVKSMSMWFRGTYFSLYQLFISKYYNCIN